jgi:hypothetical protein
MAPIAHAGVKEVKKKDGPKLQAQGSKLRRSNAFNLEP